MIENTNTKQFYPGPILNDTLEISEFLFNTAEQIKIKHSKFDEDGILRDVDLVYGQDYEVLKDEALTCDDGSEPPSHAHIMEMGLTASTGQITLKEHIHVVAGERLTAYRESAIIQDKNYPRTGAFPAATHEGALDYLTMQNQEQQDELDRALKVPISTQNFAGSMPLPIPGRALKINQDGSGFEMSEFDPDIALTTTENFRNEAQQFASEAALSASSAKGSETIASQKVNEITQLHNQYTENITSISEDYKQQIDTKSTNYLNQINSRGNTIIKDADAIINRVGLNMFDTVVKDHVLTFEESLGLALQGTYIYHDAIVGERFGYQDFYNKCLEEFKEAAYYEGNTSWQGSLTNSAGVVSGFSTANYLGFPQNFNPSSGQKWEMVYKIKTGSDVNTEQYICSFQKGATNETRYATRLSMKNANLWMSVTYQGTAWDIVSEYGTYVFQPNTTYWVKLEFTGSAYITSYSLDGIIFNTDKVILSNTSMYNACTYCVIGLWNNGATLAPWLGSIDLNGSYININGQRWWDGVRIRKHANGHMFYPISAKPQIDAKFNSLGMAWYYGIDEANKRIFLPRNVWYTQYASDTQYVNEHKDAGLPEIWGHFAPHAWPGSRDGAFYGDANWDNTYKAGTSNGGNGPVGTGFAASRCSAVYGRSGTVQTKVVKKLLYICVGNTVSNTAWLDVVTQVKNGAKDIEDLRAKALADLDKKEKEGVVALANASNALRETQITNCVTKVPQKIKWDLTDGKLTLHAGSVLVIPYGLEDLSQTYPVGSNFLGNDYLKVIDTQYANNLFFVWVETQKSFASIATETWASGTHLVCFNFVDNWMFFRINHVSGTTANANDYALWWRTSDNVVTDSYETSCRCSLPIFSVDIEPTNGGITRVRNVYNCLHKIGTRCAIDKGIVGVSPNGIYTDGTLNNVTYTNARLRVYNVNHLTYREHWTVVMDTAGPTHYGVYACYSDCYTEGYSFPATVTDNQIFYHLGENQLYYRNWDEPAFRKISGFKVGKVNSWEFFGALPFRAANHWDKYNSPHIVQSYSNANGSSWYRVWSDGFKEQGGGATAGNTIYFLKPFKDIHYSLFAQRVGGGNSTAGTNVNFVADGWNTHSHTTTSFWFSNPGYGVATWFKWYACGY